MLTASKRPITLERVTSLDFGYITDNDLYTRDRYHRTITIKTDSVILHLYLSSSRKQDLRPEIEDFNEPDLPA